MSDRTVSWIDTLEAEIEAAQKNIEQQVAEAHYPPFIGPVSPEAYANDIAAALIHAAGGTLWYESWGDEHGDDCCCDCCWACCECCYGDWT